MVRSHRARGSRSGRGATRRPRPARRCRTAAPPRSHAGRATCRASRSGAPRPGRSGDDERQRQPADHPDLDPPPHPQLLEHPFGRVQPGMAECGGRVRQRPMSSSESQPSRSRGLAGSTMHTKRSRKTTSGPPGNRNPIGAISRSCCAAPGRCPAYPAGSGTARGPPRGLLMHPPQQRLNQHGDRVVRQRDENWRAHRRIEPTMRLERAIDQPQRLRHPGSNAWPAGSASTHAPPDQQLVLVVPAEPA